MLMGVGRRTQRGFTLVETLAALLIFSIMTLGLMPLLASSIRGSNVSRSYTIGKTLAQEAMERVRGLPFHIRNTSKRLDVLDLYFPQGSGTGLPANQAVAGNVFTTTCTPSTAASPACPPQAIPPTYTVQYIARFVRRCDAAVTSSCQAPAAGATERYETVTVPSTYAWNGDDNPPADSNLLQLTIRTSWTVDRARTYELSSLIGDRKFGGVLVDASANVEHAVEVFTSYSSGGQLSDLTATGATSESEINSRLTVTADHTSQGGRLLLTDNTTPFTAGKDLQGAVLSASAPDDFTQISPVTSGGVTLDHVDIGRPAGILGVSNVDNVRASVLNDLPLSEGTTDLGFLEVFNQAATGGGSPLLLRDGPMVTATTVHADTADSTTDVSSGHIVSATARTNFDRIRMLPTEFQPEGVLNVESFNAEVDCLSTADPSTASATAGWAVSLRYWIDPEDGVTNGSYFTRAFDQDGAQQELEDVADENPLVYEVPDAGGRPPAAEGSDPGDVYMFPKTDFHNVLDVNDVDGDTDTAELVPDVNDTDHDGITNEPEEDVNDGDSDGDVTEPVVVKHDHLGYFSAWSSPGAPDENVSAEGRIASARIDGALTFTTYPTDPNLVQTVINVSVGVLSCRTVDFR